MVTVLVAGGGDVEERARPDGDAVDLAPDVPVLLPEVSVARDKSLAVEDGIAPALPWQPPSWEEVVAEHGDRVFRLAYRLTGNKHDAEDLTQEVFVRVFRSLSTYTPGSFEGWLHRITTNLFLDQVRRRNRIRFDALTDDASDKLEGREPSPESVVVDGVMEADVQAALDALPPDFRAAVVLADVEGLTYEEIAETLDIKLGTVRSRIHRGRSQLRATLSVRLRPGGGLGPALPGTGG